MYSGERHIDNGEAMAHNRMVEQAREAEHLRRCAESPAYKRVYERWKQTDLSLKGQQVQVGNAMQEAMNMQRVSDTMGNIDQPVRHGSRPDPLPPPAELQHDAAFGNPLSAFIFAALSSTKEQWQQIHEDVRAMEEMYQVNDKYDRQLIRLSGFEW